MADSSVTILGTSGVDTVVTVTGSSVTLGSATVSNGNHSGTNTGDQNLFSTIAVSGQSNVVADSTSDTLTLVAGTNMTITTDASTDTITFTASGSGGTPTAITVANEATDTTCFPAFFTAASGDLGPKTNTSLTFNSSTANLACTTFTGALTGNASTATTLATARNIGGTSFNGSADITPANITIANEATDTTCFPLFTTAATGDLPPKSNTNLTFNSSTANLSCTTFTGALVGNVTGNVSGNAGTVTTNANLTGDITSSGNATTAATALITSRTEDTTPDSSADYILTYDASATALKKVLIQNMPAGTPTPTHGLTYVISRNQFCA